MVSVPHHAEFDASELIHTQASTRETQRSMVSDVVNSIFEPGTNAGLVRAMSYSFYALFVTLLGMVLLTGGNWHVIALLGLSVALFISIRLFLVQIAEAEEKQRTERLVEEKAKGHEAVEASGAKRAKAE
ncbi:hypothetical protein JCM11641_002381 [Rhodosporidiobolus odoratus]